jgi:hypothetical protein
MTSANRTAPPIEGFHVQLAALPDGATVTIVVSDDDASDLKDQEERELASRIEEADREDDALVPAKDVLRDLEARRVRR